jgi:hypothetical protein
MKIQIASDLHMEHLSDRYPDYKGVFHTDADILLLPGDIHKNSQAISAFSDWPVPVFYVHGNHELYGHEYFSQISEFRALGGDDSLVHNLKNDILTTSRANVHYQEKDEAIYNGVRILGTCLWTDYMLFGEIRQEMAIGHANACLNDHRYIKTKNRLFNARDALHSHKTSIAWLEKKLSEDFLGKTIVMTHHAPHFKSISTRYENDLLSAAFGSDLSLLINKYQPDLWTHGHMHNSSDYLLGNTRVICNPRGYPLNRGVKNENDLIFENPEFNPSLVIEI